MSYIMNKLTSKTCVLVLADIVLLSAAFFLSFVLVGHSLTPILNGKILILVLIGLVQLFLFVRFGLYRAILRYASIDFLITVLKAVSAAMAVLILGLYVVHITLSAKLLFVCWVLSVAFVGGSRFVVRYYFELVQRYQKGDRVLIYGAGDLGSLALRQLKLNKNVAYSPIGFIDDDMGKKGKVVHGVAVIGTSEELEEIIERKHVAELIVAIADIDGDKLREILKRCRNRNIICRIIPGYSKLVEMENNLRSVELADLMRRKPRDLDKAAIEEYLKGKQILVTGAAGSIGSEIVRQCLTYEPKRILALDRSEYGLYQLGEELRSSKIKYLLADTTDIVSLENIFSGHEIDIIFHAAAYKHVPLIEANPVEGVKNNITSTKNLCALADKHMVRSFVQISTDKAVRPSSTMGATKRVCELIVQNFDAISQTEFVSVRFGNVLGSSGSVVPKFIEQIRNGGPVTVTHPDTTRFFMLIDEAVQLVLQAATLGKGGEIFILDMGKPVRIADMAEDLIYLMGRQPHTEIKIEFTGMRPGEKIHEELFSDEIEFRTKFKEITIGKSKMVDWNWLNSNIEKLLLCAKNGNLLMVMNIMKDLVSEGSFNDTGCGSTSKVSYAEDSSQSSVSAGPGSLRN